MIVSASVPASVLTPPQTTKGPERLPTQGLSNFDIKLQSPLAHHVGSDLHRGTGDRQGNVISARERGLCVTLMQDGHAAMHEHVSQYSLDYREVIFGEAFFVVRDNAGVAVNELFYISDIKLRPLE